MDKRIVAIENYWVSIVRDTAEFQQIAKAENPEFNELLDCIYRLLKDSFIHEATEYALERWEKILGLVVTDGMTLDERRVKILTALSIKLPYTWRVLKEMLTTVLGEDKFVLDYINDETRLIVHTDRISEDKWDAIRSLLDNVLPENIVVSEYNHNIKLSWKSFNKYNHCKDVNDVLLVNSDPLTDLTENGEFIYPMSNLVTGKDVFKLRTVRTPTFIIDADFPSLVSADNMFATNANVKRFNLRLPRCLSAVSAFWGESGEKEVIIDAPLLENCDALCYLSSVTTWTSPLPSAKILTRAWSGTKLTSFSSYLPVAVQVQRAWELTKLTKFDCELPMAENAGSAWNKCTSLSEFDIGLPSLKYGSNAFNLCILNKESVLRICSSLPTYKSGTYNITLGIHLDHQFDEEVLAAIALIDIAQTPVADGGKGWTVAIQWNGTPTTSSASTFSLRRGMPVYARLGEMEEADGSKTPILEWGHYVSDSEGYMEFTSLDEAREYFNIKEENEHD